MLHTCAKLSASSIADSTLLVSEPGMSARGAILCNVLLQINTANFAGQRTRRSLKLLLCSLYTQSKGSTLGTGT